MWPLTGLIYRVPDCLTFQTTSLNLIDSFCENHILYVCIWYYKKIVFCLAECYYKSAPTDVSKNIFFILNQLFYFTPKSKQPKKLDHFKRNKNNVYLGKWSTLQVWSTSLFKKYNKCSTVSLFTDQTDLGCF